VEVVQALVESVGDDDTLAVMLPVGDGLTLLRKR
jgi:hypothetical protein